MSSLDSPHQRNIRWWLEYFEEVVGGVALLAIIFSVSWGVVTRYITEQPATWASEVANMAFAWLTFFGASACIKYRLHPSIDMLTASAPPRLQRWIAGFNHVLLLSFFGFMTWFGARFTIASWETPSAVLQIPQSFLYGPVAVCSGLMIFRHIQVMLRGVQHNQLNNDTRGSHVG